jgi:serine/threonine protein kinase
MASRGSRVALVHVAGGGIPVFILLESDHEFDVPFRCRVRHELAASLLLVALLDVALSAQDLPVFWFSRSPLRLGNLVVHLSLIAGGRDALLMFLARDGFLAAVLAPVLPGLHRDVKGSNVLVRRGDGRGYLTDFGAGHYRGADTLTSKLLPPGTPVYRSPEAWGFLNVFSRHPTVHYPASTCDDLFALGVMAYRLVTDEYPPLTNPEERGAEVWRPGGPGRGAGCLGLPMPEKPFPGQRTPPCNKMGEVAIRKGCWFRIADAKPPCKEVGKEDAYDWQGACYLPSYPPWRQPTSHPP